MKISKKAEQLFQEWKEAQDDSSHPDCGIPAPVGENRFFPLRFMNFLQERGREGVLRICWMSKEEVCHRFGSWAGMQIIKHQPRSDFRITKEPPMPEGFEYGNPEDSKVVLPDFSAALLCLKHGSRIARKGWYGKHHLRLSTATAVNFHPEGGIDLPPMIVIFPENGNPSPWTASQADLLAEDWYIIND